MKVGLSTACFYPLETEKSLQKVGELGVNIAEIFTNSFSELQTPFRQTLKNISQYYGIRISAVHPFTSFAESCFLFSDYKRRFEDSLELYRKYSEFAADMGAKILILHGVYPNSRIPFSEFIERYSRLAAVCREFDVCIAQENVVRFSSESVEFLCQMRDKLKNDFHFVLDIKQAVRANIDPFDFVSALGANIVHLHLSDHNKECDCLPPGEGIFDFDKLKGCMEQYGYSGDAIIELYSNNFHSDHQLFSAISTIRKC